jgi:hypothetical protein
MNADRACVIDFHFLVSDKGATGVASKVNRQPRIRKRLSVRFGTSPDLPHTGFTLNLSPRGLAVATQQVQPMGKKVFVELANGLDKYKAEGLVVWSQRGVIISGVPSSMGVRLTWAEDGFFRLLAELTGTRVTAATVLAPEPALRVPVALPELETVLLNDGETTEVLPEFMTMLLDNASEAPTPIEVEPLRERVERAPRFSERLQVEFGPGVLISRQGFTLNISDTGIALAANEPVEPGELVVFKVRSRDGSVGRGAGVVAWAYAGDEDSSHATAAIGIRLTVADSTYRRLLTRISLGM